ncbi:MAG: type II toxin-antitoxin system RelE/ParE family toxin [Elusimicrobia bacterium]|nr:type II toxin-antitoxin system RelE/ParE family toxin [Elusimicrobiota bacterium]
MTSPRTFAVSWAEIAERDLAAIVDRLADASPRYAGLVLARIEQSASRLIRLPKRGRVVPELKAHGVAIYRELVCRPWRIIYRIEGGRVQITAVIDSRRNLEDLLLERFLAP